MISSHALSTSSDIPTLNSYGTVDRSGDAQAPQSTTSHNSESDLVTLRSFKSEKSSCLKPHQSETIFACFLLVLGLTLIIYVIISYWFIHIQISPTIIMICGILCFIPGSYYIVEHYCHLFRCKRNRHQRLPITGHNDTV